MGQSRSGPNRPRTGFANVGVEVEGLRELRRNLGQIEPTLQKSLRGRFKTLADKVAAAVRSAMPSRTGRARSAVKSGVSGNSAYISHGKKSVPYTPWLDFGGVLKKSGGRTNTQVRPVLREGRYLYPVIERMQPVIRRDALAAIEETKRELGL